MGSLHWLAEKWFEILNAVGVVGGLLLTGHSLHSETKTRRVANLLSLTQGQRDIWKQVFTHPQLGRVLDPDADLSVQPTTREEEIFVNSVIQHLNVAYYAMREELTVKPEGLRRDIYSFISLPVPSTIRERVKPLQDDDFVAFVEACRHWK